VARLGSAARPASEHGCTVETAEALELAAGVPDPRPARVHAVAGLAFLPWDRTRARAHLEQARDGGEDLLAGIGLAELALPDDDRRPPEIPAPVQAATPDQLAAEPAVLGFLAGRALRQGDGVIAGLADEALVPGGGVRADRRRSGRRRT
jgi:hypothetical protein